MPGPVYLHIGLGKTGTTTLQAALRDSAEALADHGVEVAGGRHIVMRRAIYDLIGRRIEGGANTGVAGAFEPFARSVAQSPADAVVVSEEMLAVARPRQIKRLVDGFAPRHVIVIVTLRDLASVLASYWQQQVMAGRSETMEEFLDGVAHPGQGAVAAGVAFWLRQDLERTLSAWETHVPRADIRIVTVPPSGSEESLEDRFAAAIGVPPGVLRAPSRTNASVGVPEAEVIRRFNAATAGNFREAHRLRLVRALRRGLLDRESTPIRIPDQPWVHERSRAWTELIRERGYPVFGKLDDLAPRVATVASYDEAAVSDAAVAALATLAQDHHRLWRRIRREQPEGDPGGLGSRARAANFRMKTRMLDKSDDSRLLGWAAKVYLKRTR